MGSHRADRRGPSRRPSRTPAGSPTSSEAYVGRRASARQATPAVETRAFEKTPVAVVDTTYHFTDADVTAELPATTPTRA